MNKRYRLLEQALRERIHAWELIPGAPADEHDTLVHRLLGWLLNGNGADGISIIIEKYLCDDLALPADSEALERMTADVKTCWNDHSDV